ncbi:MAG: glycosyltransferase family 4 protein [Acidobacteriota bacterium]
MSNLSQNGNRWKTSHVITRMIVGGAQKATLDTLQLLPASTYDLDVICGPQTGPEGELLSEARRTGVKLTVLPTLVREVNPICDLRALASLARIMKRERYHIVHTHSSKAGILGRLAARLVRVPVVVHTVHGWGHHDRMPVWERRSYILLERLLAKSTDMLLVETDFHAQKGLRDGIGTPEKYLTIRPGIDLEELGRVQSVRDQVLRQTEWPDSSVLVGTVARLAPQKAPVDFVKMAKGVAAKCPSARFLMVGDGPLRPEVERAIDDYGLHNLCHLTGLRLDVPALLKSMDVFVLTSLWEGLPRIFPEAMACRLPVVATRMAGSLETIREGQNGFLVAPSDVEALIERVACLVSNPDLRTQFGLEGERRVNRAFSVRRMVERIDQVYQQLLAEKKVQLN